MAITIDQFLRDLTERQILSGEEASAFRRELTAKPRASSLTPKHEVAKNGTPSQFMTQTAPAPDASPLILCNCLIKERIQDHENHLIFRAQHLQNDSLVAIHVLMPRGRQEAAPAQNGEAAKEIFPAGSVGILDVGRHGEMVCLCCQPLEAETLAEIVHQHEMLPLDLATESLLQTVRTLERLQNQGLRFHSISAEQLLLDEDGRIHVTGQNPAELLGAACQVSDEPIPPTYRLLQSLGELYNFLQTGQKRALPPQPEADDAEAKSAHRIFNRLTGREGAPRYEAWDELIRDLEARLKGPDNADPTSDVSKESAPAPTDSQRSAVAPTAERIANPPADAASSSARWVLIGLALLAGLIVAALVMLNQ